MNYELIKDGADFKANLSLYREFLEDCEQASHEQLPEYVLDLIENHPDCQLRFILLKDDKRQLSLIAPFIQLKKEFKLKFGIFPLWSRQVTVLKLLGSSFIHKKNNSVEHLYSQVIQIVNGADFSFDFFDVYLRSQSSLAMYLKTHRPGSGELRHIQSAEKNSYEHHLLNSYDDFMNTLSGQARKHVKRRERLFKEQGEVRLISCENEAQALYLHEKMMEITNASWKNNRLLIPPSKELLSMARLGWLRSYLLEINQEAIAYLYAIQPKDDCVHFVETCYKDSWKGFSPGRVLHFMALKHLYDCKTATVCFFGEGATDIKLELTNYHEPAITFSFYKKRTVGSCLLTTQLISNQCYSYISTFLKAIAVDKFVRKVIKKNKGPASETLRNKA